jgi:hypothetical protein
MRSRVGSLRSRCRGTAARCWTRREARRVGSSCADITQSRVSLVMVSYSKRRDLGLKLTLLVRKQGQISYVTRTGDRKFLRSRERKREIGVLEIRARIASRHTGFGFGCEVESYRIQYMCAVGFEVTFKMARCRINCGARRTGFGSLRSMYANSCRIRSHTTLG